MFAYSFLPVPLGPSPKRARTESPGWCCDEYGGCELADAWQLGFHPLLSNNQGLSPQAGQVPTTLSGARQTTCDVTWCFQ